MAKFKAIVYRTRRIEQEAVIEVEADSEDGAEAVAYEEDIPDSAWKTTDASTEDFRLGDVTKKD